MTNKLLDRMFGYRAGELDGCNVNVLMPAPFSGKHNQFLVNYITTGAMYIWDRALTHSRLACDTPLPALSLLFAGIIY